MRKENKNNDFIQQFLLFRVSLHHTFARVPGHMRMMLLKLNILICVPKMNEGLTGLERHEGK